MSPLEIDNQPSHPDKICNFKFTKNGVTSNYVIFRSDISGLGETTITIK